MLSAIGGFIVDSIVEICAVIGVVLAIALNWQKLKNLRLQNRKLKTELSDKMDEEKLVKVPTGIEFKEAIEEYKRDAKRSAEFSACEEPRRLVTVKTAAILLVLIMSISVVYLLVTGDSRQRGNGDIMSNPFHVLANFRFPSELDIRILNRPIRFKEDSLVLTEMSEILLAEKAEILKRYPYISMILSGFSNEGSDVEQMALGERLAGVIKKKIVEFGIDESRLKTMSYGKSPTLLKRRKRTVDFKINGHIQ